jgi:hypothetical protein
MKGSFGGGGIDPFHPVKSNEEGEKIINGTLAIVIEVNKMIARREYEEGRTDYWYWEKDL